MSLPSVRVEAFEGPLELLYSLIEKNEISIYDIPISEITDQYIEQMNRLPYRDMEQMSSFVLLAATLLEIKSKMLLPKAAREEEEADPREELVQRLIEYKRFKSIAEKLSEHERNAVGAHYREPDYELLSELGAKRPNASEILGNLTADALFKAFQDVLLRTESRIDRVRSGYGTVYKDLFTVADKLVVIRRLLESNDNLDFDALFVNAPKEEVVVTFLAVLEMIKSGELLAFQGDLFGNIKLTKRNDTNEIA